MGGRARSPEAPPALFPQHYLASALFPFPSPSPCSVVRASPVYPRGWTRNGGNPRKAEAQSIWELLGIEGLPPLLHCWAPGALLGNLRCQHGAGEPEVKSNARSWLLRSIVCWISVHPLYDPSSTVCSLTYLLPRQIRKTLGGL